MFFVSRPVAFRCGNGRLGGTIFQPQRKAFFNCNALFVAQRNVTSGLMQMSLSDGRSSYGARQLLIVTALVETATGVMLLVAPTLVVALLLGASLDAPAALVVA